MYKSKLKKDQDDFKITASRLTKVFKYLKKLNEMGYLSHLEFEVKKLRLIEGLKKLRTAEDPKDFLENLLKNVDNDIITLKDIIEIQSRINKLSKFN
jgi:hypothetical protein